MTDKPSSAPFWIFLTAACVITGQGIDGYRQALAYLAER